MNAKSERRVITHEEAAELIRKEWERPMGPSTQADEDAFDYFASQQSSNRKAYEYLLLTLFGISIVLFLAALILLFAVSTPVWPLAFCVAACVLSLIATALGTFIPRR